VANAERTPLAYTCVATSLYFCYVNRGSPTLADGDLTFRFTCNRN